MLIIVRGQQMAIAIYISVSLCAFTCMCACMNLCVCVRVCVWHFQTPVMELEAKTDFKEDSVT